MHCRRSTFESKAALNISYTGGVRVNVLCNLFSRYSVVVQLRVKTTSRKDIFAPDLEMADNRVHDNVPASGMEGAAGVENVDSRLDGSTPELKNLQELTHFVQSLLQQMQDKFQAMSDQVLTRIDEMGTRIEDLERNIGDLMTQAGVEGGSTTNK